MSIREGDVYKRLENNYREAIKLLPEDLAGEFQQKIITLSDLNEYTSYIWIAIQFKDQTSMLRIQNWMVEHFKRGNFGKKLAERDINPSQVYERILKDILDY
ncbi:MAG: hypothetical protein JXA46_06875 [Dehalococcoidales bacterium]|nr:hypothetical protein [Dehalococcoidales bacterium]